MDFSWFWQGMLTNLFFYLLVAGVGILIGILKRKAPGWASPFMYGLVASTLVALLIVAINVQHKFVIEQKSIATTENIQVKIRQWLSTFGYGFKVVNDANYDFLLWVNVNNNRHVAVGKAKQYPQYIIMQINLNIPDDIQKLLSKLSLDKQKQIRRDLRIEMYRLQPERAELLGISEKTEQILLNGLSFEKRLPITHSLTESVFIKALVDMDTARNLLQEILAKDLGQ
jgi:hypothetical protein